MFNLEQSIIEWRQQMLAAGIKRESLEEVKSHLREEIDRQMKSGRNARHAFEISVAQIGEAALVGREFKKIENIRVMAIIMALFGMMFGMGAVLPQLGHWSRTGSLLSPAFLAMGTALVFAGGIVAMYSIRTRRETRGRRIVGLAIIAAGIFNSIPLIQCFFLPSIHLGGWVFCTSLAAASALFFGICFYFNKRIPAVMAG